MARVTYEENVRNAFLNAAREARAAGKTWGDAHEAAKAAGYGGSVQGITKMLNAEGAAASPKRGKRRGRPPGSGKKQAVVAGLDPIQAAINEMVRQKVQAILERAISELENAKKAL